MLGILYLILSFFVGYNFLKWLVPRIFKVSKESSLAGRTIKLSNWMVTLPAAFLSGTLLSTWVTYLSSWGVAKIFPDMRKPLIFGNVITFLILAGLAVFISFKRKEDFKQFFCSVKKINLRSFNNFVLSHKTELIFVVVCTVLWSFFMIRSFNIGYIDGGDVKYTKMGVSVFSDFGAHVPMIRSFSEGLNFPTDYPHHGKSDHPNIFGNDIRYHFMFQFLSGNLEFLGIRIDWAFNIPSILSIVAFMMLLYSLAVLIFGNRFTGILAAVLYFFRSSFAVFTYAAGLNLSIPSTDKFGINVSNVDGLLKYPAMFWNFLLNITDNTGNIGKTAHEDWGFYAQKVFVNKRHYAFALGIAFLVLIILFPTFKKMINRLKKARKMALEEIKNRKKMQEALASAQNIDVQIEPETLATSESIDAQIEPDALSSAENGEAEIKTEFLPINEKSDDGIKSKVLSSDKNNDAEVRPVQIESPLSIRLELWFREFLFSKDAWLPESMKRSFAAGILLGLIGFWNGSVVISTLPVLFFMAIFSKHKLEYLNMAVVTGILVYGQILFFTGAGATAGGVTLSIGYLAEFPGGINYMAKDFLIQHKYSDFIGLVPDLAYNIFKFYFQLLGLLPLLLLLALPFSRKGGRWLTLAFLSPILLATFCAFSMDVGANHVIIIYSVILLNIIVANLLSRLFVSNKIITPLVILGFCEAAFWWSSKLFKYEKLFVPVSVGALSIVVLVLLGSLIIRRFNIGRILSISTATILLIALISSGIVDGFVLYNMDKHAGRAFEVKDPTVNWVMKKTNPKALFLINSDFIHPVLLAGRKVFNGGGYLASTAGYDWDGRYKIVKAIYGASNAETLKKLVKDNKIDYIVVDNTNRENKEYELNEDLIKNTFSLAFADDASNTAIYEVK